MQKDNIPQNRKNFDFGECCVCYKELHNDLYLVLDTFCPSFTVISNTWYNNIEGFKSKPEMSLYVQIA